MLILRHSWTVNRDRSEQKTGTEPRLLKLYCHPYERCVETIKLHIDNVGWTTGGTRRRHLTGPTLEIYPTNPAIIRQCLHRLPPGSVCSRERSRTTSLSLTPALPLPLGNGHPRSAGIDTNGPSTDSFPGTSPGGPSVLSPPC